MAGLQVLYGSPAYEPRMSATTAARQPVPGSRRLSVLPGASELSLLPVRCFSRASARGCLPLHSSHRFVVSLDPWAHNRSHLSTCVFIRTFAIAASHESSATTDHSKILASRLSSHPPFISQWAAAVEGGDVYCARLVGVVHCGRAASRSLEVHR